MSSDPEHQPPAPSDPVIAPKTPASSPAPSPMTPFWLYGVPIVCLVLMLIFWGQTRRDIATLTEQQRQLSADLDAARGLTTINVAGAPALGPADQVVTLIEFSDYECPFCIRHVRTTMPGIVENFIQTGKIRYVFQDFPIAQLHPGAGIAHEAAHCAGAQGKYWQVHSRLFSAPGTHGAEALERVALDAGLTLPAFTECLAGQKMRDTVAKSIALGAELGVNGTPSFFVGLRNPATDDVKLLSAITGARPYEDFEKAILAATERAGRSR